MWERNSSSISCSWRERLARPLNSDFRRASMNATPRVPRRMIYQPLLDSQGEEGKKNISRRDAECTEKKLRIRGGVLCVRCASARNVLVVLLSRQMRLLLGLVAACLLVHAADWPRFRGPNGFGVGENAALPSEFGPSKNVIWKTPLPPGHSSPILTGNRIFLTAFEGQKLFPLGLDRAT